MNFLSIIAFIIVFGLIVTFHEFGHFLLAKKFGVIVHEFSIGMGPKIFSVTKSNTKYVIRLLPVGGYVAMAGAEENQYLDYLNELRPGRTVTIGFSSSEPKLINYIDIRKIEDQVDQDGQLLLIKSIDYENSRSVSGFLNSDQEDYKSFKLSDYLTINTDQGEIAVAPKSRQLPNIALWKQAIINFAGPFMNFVLALILFVFLAITLNKVPVSTTKIEPIPNYPAIKQGLRRGDRIVSVDSVRIHNWNQMVREISKTNGQSVDLTYERNDKLSRISIKPRLVTQAGQKRYLLGIEQYSVTSGSLKARFSYAFSSFFDGSTAIWRALGNLILHPSLNQLGGPVMIAKTTNQAVNNGFFSLVSLTALLSLNIGIFNLIPIPVLDGGKLLLNLIEAIRGKPLKDRTNQTVLLIGVVFMILLMIAVTINDLLR
ncbi:RIP metalloprotease RseP [Oenococcus alcoholitolerans]|uniref:RIP metalloprotease RseP n=1 Tax=Oenococcus alcoholitolerans TaxID=931074 RepID=UPI003F70A895